MRRSAATRALGLVIALVSAAVYAGCSGSSQQQASTDGGTTGPTLDAGPGSTPIDGISSTLQSAFADGETAFKRTVTPEEGLGPLYTKTACSDCHTEAARGPGAATKMVVVLPDGVTPSSDQSLLPYGNTEHPEVVTAIPGVHSPILPPFLGASDGGSDAGNISIKITPRVGPPLFGRGYIDAVDDSEIENMRTLQASRTDSIHGRINYVTFDSQANPDPTYDPHQPGDRVIGRFGLKARIGTLDEFVADALQTDMGMTSPMRQTEFDNPDHVSDDLKAGVDVTAEDINSRAAYVRMLAIPPRDVAGSNGHAWFVLCNCNVCHAEVLRTRADYPIPQLANVDAPLFSDLLLHDMGDNLADSVQGGNEGSAGPRDWRTAPLIGMRFNTTFLHDGRSTTIEDAIVQHASPGSEASDSVTCFNGLGQDLRQQLLDYVGAL